MEVKSFEAYTMRDALKAVKTAFGPDAVILRTREKSSNSSASGKVIEITATAASSVRSVGASSKDDDSPRGSAISEFRLNALEDMMSEMSRNVAKRQNVEELETGIHELKLLLLESLRSKSGSSLENLPTPLVAIEHQLRIMGVDSTYVASLMKHLQTCKLPLELGSSNNEELEEYYRNEAIRWMMKRIKIAPRSAAIPGSPSIHAFLGTTGVGKTSIVAKLASHYHLKDKAKVLIASFDNHRIAASEQLKIYAKIIGIPFVSLVDLNELAGVIEKHSDVDIILMDTAGRSPKNERYLTELESLRSDALPIENHLVLSTSEKEIQLDRTVRYFSKLGIHSLIFTKLDQSWSYGEIYNLTTKWNVPLSYFSTGADVPDGLERASRERVIERIFGI